MKIPLPLPKGAGLSKDLFVSVLQKLKGPQKPELPQACIAVDFGKSKIVLLEVELFQNKATLTKFHKIARPADHAKDAEVLRQAFESGGYRSEGVRISVKGQGVVLRFIQFPQMKVEELRGAISFEIEQYIPFKAPEVVWDFHVLDENIALPAGGTGMNILLVAVKRDELFNQIQLFQSAGLQIELIDVDALAAINALEFFQPEKLKLPTALLDIGSEVSTLSIILDGKPRFIRDISYGGFDMIKKLKRKLGLTQEQAVQQIEVDQQPTPEAEAILKEALSDLVSELKLSLNYYLDQVPGSEPVKALVISGGGGYHPVAVQALTAELGFTVETMDILSSIQLGSGLSPEVIKSNQGLLPVSLGLCVRRV